jgi:6-phosphogluconolactonase
MAGCFFLCACDGSGGIDLIPTHTIPAARERLIYVSVHGESRLAVVTLSEEGMLTEEPSLGMVLPGRPGAMAYVRGTRNLYIGMKGKGGHIATINLESSGQPGLLGTSPTPSLPVYVDVSPDGSTLVTAYFGGDRIISHRVGGLPPHEQLSILHTADEPHQTKIGPTGDLVYVPHRNGQRIEWYSLEPGGLLQRRGGIETETEVGPRHLDFSPGGKFAYVINEYDDSISAYRVGTGGSLTRFQTTSTLPPGFNGSNNTGADIHVLPSGRFLYASNRGHDSIAMFAIEENGRLRSLGQIVTESHPREFDVSPDGRFLVVAGRNSGFIQSFMVQSDGRLKPVDRIMVGKQPVWLIIE